MRNGMVNAEIQLLYINYFVQYIDIWEAECHHCAAGHNVVLLSYAI